MLSKETLLLFAELLGQVTLPGHMGPDELEDAARRLVAAKREVARAIEEVE